MSNATNSASGFAEVNGTQIYYEVAGEGHPLVLIHAGIADSRMWDDQFSVFAQHYRVLRYDLRGYGKSACPPGPYALRDDLHALLQHLNIAKAHLIGVSMGGSLAVDFTLTHPDMVSALITVCAGLSGFEAPDDPDTTAYIQQLIAADKAGDKDQLNELEVHLWVDGLRRTPEQVNPTIRERVREMNGLALSREAETDQAEPQRLDPPAAGRLSEIHAPTLVIIGDEDLPGVRATADKLATDISGARKAVIHNAAHVPNMERPDAFNRIVLDFLASLA
ncbi:MAG: Beta-ketoadipate enol-lactone hydrolase [Ktedonobacterales bacterium]|jgi:pimeloyl-ACP methyl ester carboxylesterase|nr:MAG: Beta-ketoadipate enol-lactone hydrolase [Ktedonobacterales bacterium]